MTINSDIHVHVQIDNVVHEFIDFSSKVHKEKVKQKDDMRHRLKRIVEIATKNQKDIQSFQAHVMR